MMKVLLLSGGSLVGRNLLDVWEARRAGFQLIATNSQASEPTLFEYDEVLLSPESAVEGEDFQAYFEGVMTRYDPDWVIPCRDDDVLFLARQRQKATDADKTKFLAGSESIARAFLDKWESLELSRTLGLPYAKTISANSEPAEIERFLEKVGFPILAKPKKGFASHGVFLITEHAQLQSLTGLAAYIFQEYLGDPKQISVYLEKLKTQGVPLFHTFEETKVSVQASIGPQGEFGGILVTLHLMKQGISNRVDLCMDETLVSAAQGWVDKLIQAGWAGPLNIQCQKNQQGELVIYEFNGRFTGATSARYKLGFDELGNLLSLWKGVTLPNPLEKTTQVSVKRIPASCAVSPEQVALLTEDKCWKKDLNTDKEVVV